MLGEEPPGLFVQVVSLVNPRDPERGVDEDQFARFGP
jgi:hypothetical protein